MNTDRLTALAGVPLAEGKAKNPAREALAHLKLARQEISAGDKDAALEAVGSAEVLLRQIGKLLDVHVLGKD